MSMSETPDLGGLLKQAQEMQQQLMAAQSQAAEQEVVGVSGGGVVTVRMTAASEVLSVSIAPEVVDPNDVAMLEDLVTAAMRDALARGAEAQAEAMGVLDGMDLGGLGLGDLLG
jgi:DNA-binding YbaB/EbfC family protein